MRSLKKEKWGSGRFDRKGILNALRRLLRFPFCLKCVTIFTLFRWRLTRSLGGIKTDEVFARLLLNLWENNRKFINVSRRSATGEDSTTKQELNGSSVGPDVVSAASVDIKGKPIKSEALISSSDPKEENGPKRRRTSLSPVPPLPSSSSPPRHHYRTTAKSDTEDLSPEESIPAREVRKILSPSNTRVPQKAEDGIRSKRQIGRPKKFDDFTVLRHSTVRRTMGDDAPYDGVLGSGRGSFAAARSALASTDPRGDPTTPTPSFSSVTPLSTVPSAKSEMTISLSKYTPSMSSVTSNVKAGSRLTFIPVTLATAAETAAAGTTTASVSRSSSVSNINAKEANERLIQRCIRERGVSLPVKERNNLSKSLDDGALNVDEKTEIVGNFLRQYDENTNKKPCRSVEIKEEESNDSLSSWTEENVKSGSNDNVHDHEFLIDRVLREKEMTHRHLHYLKRAELRALLRDDDLRPLVEASDRQIADVDETPDALRKRRRLQIIEAFVEEILSKTKRLDAVIASVDGADSLDGVSRNKLKQKLKKRVLEEDDDAALSEVVKEFLSELKGHNAYIFEVDRIHGKSGKND